LFKKYHPIEIDDSISLEDKMMYINEWYSNAKPLYMDE
jgi:hypothetical protein